MAKAHGKDASVTYTNITVAVHGFTFTYNDAVVDVTDFADAGVTARIRGKTDWEATLDAFWDPTNTAKPGDAAATLTLTPAAAKTIVGSALIGSMTITASNDDVNSQTYNMLGTGAVTITN